MCDVTLSSMNVMNVMINRVRSYNGYISHIMQMESDVAPIRSNWLSAVTQIASTNLYVHTLTIPYHIIHHHHITRYH
jgi:hypothetical protein